MVAAPSQAPARPPALLEATKKSTAVWQQDLERLFQNAKERFPDVVWELMDDDAAMDSEAEEIWGHKGLLYIPFTGLFHSPYTRR